MSHSTTKHCTGCQRDLPATREFFHLNKRGKYGLRSKCKECSREKDTERKRQWRLANPGHESFDTESRRKYKREWYAANSESERERARKKYIDKPEFFKKRDHERRARESKAEGKHTAADVRMQYERQKGRCYYAACGHSELNGVYHVDHIIPLSRGGTNWPDNIVCVCAKCNLSKGNKLPHEWAEGGTLL